MESTFPYSVRLKFPGDLDYIAPVRKFVAEMLQAVNFGPKFAYRSEIVVDEICYNAITFGCQSPDATVEIEFSIHEDRMELVIKDPGKGDRSNRERLRHAVDGNLREADRKAGAKKEKLGLEIVKMLSEELNFEIDNNNLTSVRVVRKREEVSAKP